MENVDELARSAQSGTAPLQSTKTHLIFTYGTLRPGEHNTWILDEHSKHIGTFATKDKYLLLTQTGHRSFPYLIPVQTWPEMKHLATCVKGDVFALDDYALDRCDRLESHPRWYKRTPITLNDGSRVEAYILTPDSFKELQDITVIESGDWKFYEPPHEKKSFT